MIFYRLALEKLITYLHLDELFKEDEFRLMLLHKKPKEVYRTRLRTSPAMNLCVSILLSILNLLICITIPYAALESPTEALKNNQLHTLYNIAVWIERYLGMIDRAIIAVSILLILVWGKTTWDGIRRTNIKMSPWLERGKYVLPERVRMKEKRKH